MSKTKKPKTKTKKQKLKGYTPHKTFSSQDEYDETLSHFGKFRVTGDFMLSEFKIMRDILKTVTVINVEHDAITGTVVFLGVSKHFEKTTARMMDNAPEYSLKISNKTVAGEMYYKYHFEKAFDSLTSKSIH